jgi:hypothetical protein
MLDTAADTMHLEVFFIDASTGWATAEFDDDRNQIGEAAFNFHKKDAIREARFISQGVFEIHVFGKDGTRQANAKTSTSK